MDIVVETVVPLTAAQKSAVAELCKKKFGTTTLIERINKEMLGGIRITAGSTQYDASVLGKLQQLRAV